jgi:hypothetical protein
MLLSIVMFINVHLLNLLGILVCNRFFWPETFYFLGSWHYAFDILSSLSIVTNTALIAMQPSVREYFSAYTDAEYILLFVAAEV